MKSVLRSAWLVVIFFFTISALASEESYEYFTVSQKPGRYSLDQDLTLYSKHDKDELYYTFTQREGQLIRYTVPLHLSALPDETRVYPLTIVVKRNNTIVEERKLSYVIDKSVPEEPQPTVAPGSYAHALNIGFEKTPKSTNIYYSINSATQRDYSRWEGESIDLSVLSEKSPTVHTLYAYAENKTGNKSRVKSWTYTMYPSRAASSGERELEVLSPVSGEFANKQFLYIKPENYKWVRYTINGGDPAEKGTTYSEPTRINLTGELTLRVAAASKNGNHIVRKTVSYTVSPPQKQQDFTIESGVYSDSLNIALQTSQPLYYTVDETSPDARDARFHSPLELPALQGGVKYYSFRLQTDNGLESDIPEYRYFFVIDNRVPEEPIIQVSEHLPVNTSPEIEIISSNRSTIRYTTDGTRPDRFAPVYTGPFKLTLPRGMNSGTMTIRAKAYAPNGLSGKQVTKIIPFDRQPPERPVVTIEKGRRDTDVQFSLRCEQDDHIVYEASTGDKKPEKPTIHSPRCPTSFLVALPYGMQQTFNLRFCCLDKAGNISEPTEVQTVTIDKKPPPKPLLVFENGKLSIQTTEETDVFYTLTSDNTFPDYPEKADKQYTEPIPLPGEEGKRITYHICAIAVDAHGNQSEIAGPKQFVNDQRSVGELIVRGVKDGGLYNTETVELSLEKQQPELSVFYTVTRDGTEPATPTKDSPVAGNSITVSGEEGKEIPVRVKLLPVLIPAEEQGEIQEFRFIIDRKAPHVPKLQDFENGLITNREVTLSLEEQYEDETVFYSISHDKDAVKDPFGEEGKIFSDPVTIDVASGKEKTFYIVLGSEDPAGNRSINQQHYHFTIDRKPPSAPEVTGLPGEKITNGPVQLAITSKGNTIFYNLLEERMFPLAENREQRRFPNRYEQPITVQGRDDEVVTYFLHVQAEDRAGNRSFEPAVYRFTIDRETPNPPPEPTFSFAQENPDTVTVSWSPQTEAILYYRISTQSKYAISRFKPYGDPITVSPTNESFTIDYFYRDKAGNSSQVLTSRFVHSRVTDTYSLEGVAPDRVYNEDVVMKKQDYGEGIIRYEVAAGNHKPAPVTQFSPQLPREYHFRATSGEEAVYSIATRKFSSPSDPIGDGRKLYSFVIDKKAPPVPVIRGVKHNHHYQEPFQIEMDSGEGQVYYALAEEGQDFDYKQYTDSITIEVPPGEFTRYTLRAFAEDDAGNRSPTTRDITFYIDKKVIYLSKEEGNDLFDGTREKPFQTLQRAIEEAKTTERKTIFLQSGTYTINHSINVEHDIKLVGGFENNTWHKRTDGMTTVKPGRYFPHDNASLVTVTTGTLEVENIGFSDPDNETKSIFRLEGGKTVLEDIRCVERSPYPHPIIMQKDGHLTLKNCTFTFGKHLFETFLQVRGGTIRVEDSVFMYERGNDGFTVISCHDVEEAHFSDAYIDPGNGKQVCGVSLNNSSAVFEHTDIGCGIGTIRSVGVEAENSHVTMRESRIQGNAASRISVGIHGDSSTITLLRSGINVLSKRGATGIFLKNSSIDMRKSTLDIGTSAEYMYGAKLIECEGVLFNNHLFSGQSSEFVGVELDSSKVKIYNNTAIFGSSTHYDIGFSLKNSGESDFINNIVAHRGEVTSAVAVRTVNSADSRIISNNFTGWETVFSSDSHTVKTVKELDLLDGQPFDGTYTGNISEPVQDTFAEEGKNSLTLKKTSRCVNGGYNVLQLGGPRTDREGQVRPNPHHGMRPEFDIGSDEYYSID